MRFRLSNRPGKGNTVVIHTTDCKGLEGIQANAY